MTKDLSEYKQPFDPDWPHGHLHEGSPARIIATDRRGDYPIVALIQSTNEGPEWVSYFPMCGKKLVGELVNAPAPKRTWWVNLYLNEYDSCEFIAVEYDSREKADKSASSDRIACIKVTEGEGL